MRVLATWLILAASAAAFEPAPLPPEQPWDGASRRLVAAPSDAWITPAEASSFRSTPSYAATIGYLEKLAAKSPQLKLTPIARSAEGRDVMLAVLSRAQTADPDRLRAGDRVRVLVQAGIHAGEIDGKDAGLMLIRDLVRDDRGLLEHADFLFVPILNVDGHERTSDFSRLHQRGPTPSGWRTNARNQNLNRDFTKLDSEEIRGIVATIGRYQPDLFVDAHVTDGADYQYDITWGWALPHAFSPNSSRFLDAALQAGLEADVRRAGHVPGPLIFDLDRRDPSVGTPRWTDPPRFSEAYGDIRHLPTILIENHSLKSYERRVLAIRVFLDSLLRQAGANRDGLRRAAAADRALRRNPVPLEWGPPTGPSPTTIELLGIESRIESSTISGGTFEVYTGRPITQTTAYPIWDRPTITVARPLAYLVPPAWTDVIERLDAQGIRSETLRTAADLEVEMYRFAPPQLETVTTEGRVRMTAAATPIRRRQSFPPGTRRISTDQPLGDFVVHLLEPSAPDSFFQWGFFGTISAYPEYFEDYVMEPLARRMLAEDPDLQHTFDAALAADPELAKDAQKRWRWFYARTPYYDDRFLLYPVARVVPLP